ncbi:GMP/IMP nucleotidase [Aliidiomarina celeris]|uniref:GMP/IMP nucleotidase n=1 Tax=Aliidiomarina celeris TaxID=2249428 RepID=UPI000DE8EFA5|nr:GMP/IMP nucleotidase [Aliidiomarina celeris]
MLNWNSIDTVLLDMDGTLLDLHYDNHFWLNYLPECFAVQHNLPLAEAKDQINQKFAEVAGTLNWYSLDYWERTLGLPIRQLKARSVNKIKYRADAPHFLESLRSAGKQVALVTNAHPDALALKNQHTDLAQRCPLQFSTHEFGYCKEFQELWQGLQQRLSFDPARTLFVDDGEHILDSAERFGIRYTLGIRTPDSQQAEKVFVTHASVDLFSELPALTEL